jgi:hypothetical protein
MLAPHHPNEPGQAGCPGGEAEEGMFGLIVILAYIRRGQILPPRRTLRVEEETQRRLARMFRRYQDGLIPIEDAQRFARYIRIETEGQA